MELASVCELLTDDQGQDLIEYALLSAFIGLVSVVTWGLIAGQLGTGYSAFDTNTQAIWASPDPVTP